MTAIAGIPRTEDLLHAHIETTHRALRALRGQVPRLAAWAEHLRGVLCSGGRLLVAGNGGSAALAQHLTSELVGRYRDDRDPFSALCLSSESSSLTAIGNDYGFARCFSRQVEAHGRAGDVLLVLSTSGRSANLLEALDAARRGGLATWAMTGPQPNPAADGADEALAVDAPTAASVQDVQQVAVHLLCTAFDQSLERGRPAHGPSRRHR